MTVALLDVISDRLAAAEDLRLEKRERGFEVLHVDEVGEASRPRIYVFDEEGRIVAFFYKPSRLAFSRDRFAYGAMFLYEDSLDEALADALDFLRSGFHPDGRPKRLKRSLSFTVPE